MKRLGLFIIALLAIFSVSFVLAEKQGWMEADFVRAQFENLRGSSGGKTTVFLSIVALLAVDLLLPVPSSIVMVLAGVFLGTYLGAAAAFVGAMIAALTGYYGCRFGGTKAFDRLVGKTDVDRVGTWFEDYGIAAIIISRPVPMLTEILSCMAGLSRVKQTSFIVSSIVGTLPICFIYAYVGDLYGLGSLDSKEGIGAMIWITVAIPACGWLFTHWVKKMRQKKNDGDETPTALVVWCRILRLPNIFTVPGDALVGALLATGGEFTPAAGWAALAVVPLYLGGLVLNDFFDRKEDAEERPDRPIPAGHVRPVTALVVGLVLLGTGIAIAFLTCSTETGIVALGIAAAVLAYDAGGRKIPLLGPTLMGACRAGSVLLGAYAVGGLSGWALQAVLVAWAYTVAITLVAARETEKTPPRVLIHLPAVFLGLVGISILRSTEPNRWPVAMVLFWAMTEASMGAFSVAKNKLPVPALIGRLIRIMLTVQTAWILLAISTDMVPAIVCLAIFLALRLAAKWSSRKFYGS